MPFLTFYVKLSWKKNLKNSAALNWMDSVVKSEAGKARVQRRLCLESQDRCTGSICCVMLALQYAGKENGWVYG